MDEAAHNVYATFQIRSCLIQCHFTCWSCFTFLFPIISGNIKKCQFSVFGLYVPFYKALFISSRIDLLIFPNRVVPFILIDLKPEN